MLQETPGARRIEPPPNKCCPLVAILIPTHNETRDVIISTCESALAAARAYGPAEIWLLDDGDRPELAKLALELGLFFVGKVASVVGKEKGANLNKVLFPAMRTSAEYLAVCDVGDSLTPDFLTTLVPLIHADQALVLVQSGSYDANCDPIQRLLGLGHRAEGQAPKEEPEQVLLNGRHFFCTGSGFLVRTEAVIQLGGFPSGCVADDAELSMRLHARGRQSAGTNKPLVTTAVPEFLGNYVSQQCRWLKGNFQLLKLYRSKSIEGVMPRESKVKMMRGVIKNLFEASTLLLLLLPMIMGMFLPRHALNLYAIVAYILFLLGTRVRCAQAHRRGFRWESIYCTIAALPLNMALLAVLRDPWAQRFVVTLKTRGANESQAVVALLRPLWTYLAAYSALTVYVLCVLAYQWRSVETALLAGITVGQLITIAASICICRRELQRA